MMGVQTTCGKRKLEEVEVEAGSGGGGTSPCKAARWDNGAVAAVTPAPDIPTDDCLARLRAVAAVPECGPWLRPAPPHPAQSDDPLGGGHTSDEDEWDDELSDYEELTPAPLLTRGVPPSGYWLHQHQQQHYYHQQQQQPQQTIRRDENGKSYLELGAAPGGASPTAATTCYRQRRLAVLNLSMCKLARYRQCSDPSLRRSVLICNTLRRIEREMEREGHQQQQQQQQQQSQQQWYQQQQHQSGASDEYGLREMTGASGRCTPFPGVATQACPDTPSSSDSGYDSSDRAPINWGSVLSLTAHADLADPDSLNNNLDLVYQDTPPPERPPLQSPPPELPPPDAAWDSFVHVLVSGT